MRRMLFSLLAVLALAMPAFAAGLQGSPDKDVFELKDGYVQVDIDEPYHLVHGSVPAQKVRLGESFRVWYNVRLKMGATCPCTARDDEPCYFEFRLVPKDADRRQLTYNGHEFRTSLSPDGDGLSLGVTHPVTRDAVLGEKIFLVRVRFKDRILYSHEFPMLVRE